MSAGLPLDRPRPPVPSYAREQRARPVPPELLAALPGRTGASPRAAVAAALEAIAARCWDAVDGREGGWAERARRADAEPPLTGPPLLVGEAGRVEPALLVACDVAVLIEAGALCCDYDPDLFDPETIERLLAWLVDVLGAAPDTPVHRLPRPRATDVSAAPSEEERPGGLLALFADRAAALASSPAVIAEDGSPATYAGVADGASRVAALLRAHGVARGDRVGVLLPRGPALVSALLGVLRAGAAYLALDPDDPAGRLSTALAASGARLVVTGAGLAARLPAGTRHVPVEEAAGDGPIAEVAPDDAALVHLVEVPGAGPVLVEVTHRAAARVALALAEPGERWLAASPVASDRHVLELWGPLLNGGVCVLAAGHPVDAALLTAGTEPALAAAGPRRLVLPGDDAAAAMLDDVRDRLGEAVRVTLAHHVDGLVFACARELDGADDLTVAGRPLPGLTVGIRDRLGEPAAIGAFGQVLIDSRATGDTGRLRAGGSLELLRPAEAPAPEPGPPPAAGTPEEAGVAAVFAELLGVEHVDPGENFFALGGDSLAAARAAARIRENLGVDVGADLVFRAPTVRAMVDAVAGARAAPGSDGPTRRVQRLPLSFAQEGIWLFEQLEPGSATYHVPYVVRLVGAVDAPALEAALQELVRRHEALRTTVAVEDGRPVQRVHPDVRVRLAVDDLTPDAADAAIAAEAIRPFDLSRGPLLRARLLRLAPDDHRLLLTLHHLACDGRSMEVLLGELGALSAGRSLPEPALQYGDVAAWQREVMTPERIEGELRHWEEALRGAPTDQPLPIAGVRPPVLRHRGDTLSFALPPGLVAELRALGRREGATLFSTLLAVFHALLHRHSGRDDLVTGTAVDGRTRPELRDVVGPCLNTVVLRADLSGDPSLVELVRREQAAVASALAHQEVPFALVARRLAPERDPGRAPLFQVFFVVNGHTPIGRLWDAAASGVQVPTGTSKFDLMVELADQGDAVTGQLSYVAELFEPAFVDRLLAGYLDLLERMLERPETRLSELGGRVGSAECLHHLFEEQVARTPAACAVRWTGGELTYGALDAGANRLARRLLAVGAGPEARVGVCAERSPELLIGLLGVLKAGAAYVPLDPDLPRERIELLLADTRAVAVAAGPGQAALVEREGRQVVPIEVLPGAGEPAPGAPVSPRNLAYVVHTSGSTGRPKGVLIEHRSLVHYLRGCATYTAHGGHGAPLISSFAFDMAVTSLFAPLLRGQTVHLPAPDLDLGLLGRTLAAMGPFSFVKLTPGHLALLADQLEPDQARALTGTLVVGGEALPPALVRRWRGLAPGTRLLNEYGPTEGTVGSVRYAAHAHEGGEPVPIGRATPGTTALVLDRDLRPAAPGVPGEIFVGGACVARGYLGRPDLTAERFLPDPHGQPGSRLYRTGDAGRLRDDGDLECLGRLDDQLKLHGFRIEPGEVEEALGEHPGVGWAVVAAAGRGATRRLAAYVVPARPATPPAEAELRRFLGDRLPAHLVPATFTLVESVPLTRSGKVDRAALTSSPPSRPSPREAEEQPATPALERVLAEIWAEVLELDGVGVEDDFFQLGGSSLEMTLAAGQVRRRLDLDVPVATVFQAPTVRQLAAALVALHGDGVSRTAELLLRIREMSPEERRRLLEPTEEESHGHQT